MNTEFATNRTTRTMPAISLWQPWASALFALLPDGRPLKPDETRHWPLPARYVGVEIAIHAAKHETEEEREFWREAVLLSDHLELYGHAFAALGISKWSDLPRSCIVGTVVFGPCRQSAGEQSVEEVAREWGNYEAGRYAWPTTRRTPFAKPIPCVGRQGFFSVEIPTV